MALEQEEFDRDYLTLRKLVLSGRAESTAAKEWIRQRGNSVIYQKNKHLARLEELVYRNRPDRDKVKGGSDCE